MSLRVDFLVITRVDLLVRYLLGSGGTLLFDVTIVTQSFLYKPGRKPLHQRTRSQSHSHARGSSHHPHGSSYSRGGSAARIPRSNSSTGTFGGGVASRTGSVATARPQHHEYFSRSRSTSAIVADGHRNEEARALLSADSLVEDASDTVEVLSSSDAHARRRRDGTLESAET